MTHTTLETQPFTTTTSSSTTSSSVVKNSPSPYLSVKSSTVSLSPILEEPVGYTTNDIYDYDVNLSQPLQGDDPVSYYYSTETREVSGETFFSYKVLPPSET